MNVSDGAFKAIVSGSAAVSALTHVMLEKEKTRRLLIGLAGLLFVVAALVVIFAPPHKQALSYALGAALVVVALGAIGASQFHFKMPAVSIRTISAAEMGNSKAAETTVVADDDGVFPK